MNKQTQAALEALHSVIRDKNYDDYLILYKIIQSQAGLVEALEYCAQDRGAMHPQSQAQFMVARQALADYDNARGK